jgi:hypothetical protein
MNVLDATLEATTALQDNLTQEIARKVEADPIASATKLAQASQSFESSRAVSAFVTKLLDPRSA